MIAEPFSMTNLSEIPTGSLQIGDCQRPLRVQTMQGDRAAIADSEAIARGAWCEFNGAVNASLIG